MAGQLCSPSVFSKSHSTSSWYNRCQRGSCVPLFSQCPLTLLSSLLHFIFDPLGCWYRKKDLVIFHLEKVSSRNRSFLVLFTRNRRIEWGLGLLHTSFSHVTRDGYAKGRKWKLEGYQTSLACMSAVSNNEASFGKEKARRELSVRSTAGRSRWPQAHGIRTHFSPHVCLIRMRMD